MHDEEAVLRALGLNARDPKVQALFLISQKYGLDMLLGEVCIVKERIFVTHSGRLSAAHKSGMLDGIETSVEETPDRYIATVKVHRKDMTYPFTFTDFCRKDERVQDARKRAITRAERNCLYRAFPIGDWDNEVDESLVTLSETRPPIPRRTPPSAGAQSAEGGPSAPGLEAAREDLRSASPPEPPSAAPVLAPGKSVVVRCTQMGLDDDERHALVRFATDGRTESTKELTPVEASEVHRLLHLLKITGEKVWHESSPTKSTSSSPASPESPAPITISSEEKPPGDVA